MSGAVKPQIQYQSVLSWNGQAPDIVSVCFVMKWSSPRHSISHFHDKTDRYYVCGLTISWQIRLILCLGLDHFTTKQTDTISGVKPQIQYQCVLSWNGQDPDIESVCFVMKWSNPRHNISLFCHEMVKPQIQFQSVLSWNGQAPDIVSVCLIISWQNKLILCLGFHHYMTKHMDTISGLNIFMTNRSILCLWFDHFMTNQTDTMIISVYFVMKWSSLRYSISVFCPEMVKTQT
jgi:hypothetical protein